MTYSLNWDLDSIFSGGVHSPALTKKNNHLIIRTNGLGSSRQGH